MVWDENKKYIFDIDYTKIDSDLSWFPLAIILDRNNFADFYEEMSFEPDDNFNGLDDDSPDTDRWGLNGSPYILSNKLRMDASASSPTETVYSRYNLVGDFDVQVDWDGLVVGTTTAWSAELRIYDESNGHYYRSDKRLFNKWKI